MAGSSDVNDMPEGTTLIFGSWACTADGTGGFSSHLVTPKSKTRSQLADTHESMDRDEKRVPPELNSDNSGNVTTQNRTLSSVEFDTNSDFEKPHFSKTLGKILGSSQDNQTPKDQKLETTRWSRSSLTINPGLHQTCRNYSRHFYAATDP